MKQTLILLPGLLCDKALWQHQIAALEGTFDIQVPDLTKHDSMPALARHVLEGAPEQFHLAGLSMGGYVAFEIMRQAPQRVKKLMLLDTTARPDSDEQRQRRRGLIELAQKGHFKGVTPRLLPLLIAQARLSDEALKQTIMDMAGRVGMEGFIRQQTAILSRVDSRPYLAEIKVPTTIVCGADDALTPPDHAHEMAALITGAQVHIIKAAGHLTLLEMPQQVGDLMQYWFA